jgi:hypothetical protein
MHLIDFSTGGVNEQQRQAVGERVGQPIADLHTVFVPEALPAPFAEGIARLVDQAGYTWEECSSSPSSSCPQMMASSP